MHFFATEHMGLRGIDWTPPEGLSLLLGPNGGGKSRLLAMPATALPAPANYFYYPGYNIHAIRDRGTTGTVRRLLPDGTNASQVDQWLRINQPEKVQWIENVMTACFPRFEGYSFNKDCDCNTFGYMLINGHEYGFEWVSPGMLTTLLHLLALSSCQKGDTYAFDPIDAGLHPDSVGVLLTALSDLLCYSESQISIIATTQSPAVVRYFGIHQSDSLDDVFLVDDRRDQNPIPLLAIRTPEWLAHFDLGELFDRGDFAGEEFEEVKGKCQPREGWCCAHGECASDLACCTHGTRKSAHV